MIRGIEGRRIFRGDDDRFDFLKRLDRLVPELAFLCFAWVLMPNHVHLVVRSGSVHLSRLMARLNTGYAMSFNLRHRRRGYLFQNRFRSRIVCSEAELIAVIRYLCRNPLEANIVGSVRELARWPWSGFAALMGTRGPRPFEAVGAALALFGDDTKSARSNLQQLVSRGGTEEAAPALLVEETRPPRETVSREISRTLPIDSREIPARPNGPADAQLRDLIESVCADHGVDPSELAPRKRPRKVSRVRAVVCYRAVVELRIPGLEVARALGVSPSAVSCSLDRGRELLAEDRTAIS
jgi:REP element-mobilizing transposase RayT